MKETQSDIENKILYNLVEALDMPEDRLSEFGLSPILFKSHKLRTKQENEPKEPIEVSGETFGKVVRILQAYDAKYIDNLSLKDDYSDYNCYVMPKGFAGCCIDKNTGEPCNLYSVPGTGLGKEILGYLLQNYDCLGIANALPDTYGGYYLKNFDVVTHHWEENWDFPGDKEKAVWYGYILPKGTLSEEDRVYMIRKGEAQRHKAYSKEKIDEYIQTISKGKTTDKHQLSEAETDRLNMVLNDIDDKGDVILSKALQKCYSVIRKNQMNSAWKEYDASIPSQEIIAKQMNKMWQHQFDKR